MATRDQYYTGGNSDWLEIYGNRRGGQKFTAGEDANIFSVKINIKKEGTPNDLVIALYTKHAVSNMPDTLITSEEVSASLITTDYSWIEIEFSALPTQVNGTEYFIVIYQKTNGGDSSNSYWWKGNSTSSGAVWSTNAGSSWGALGGGFDFETWIVTTSTIWKNINTDIRVLEESLYDINGDIRVVSIKESLRDMNCNINTAIRLFSDLNCNIRVTEDYTREYDINCDIRVGNDIFEDINCDIRTKAPTTLEDIECDIRVLSRNIYDINCDIRVKEDGRVTYDINSDIRVKQRGAVATPDIPEAIGLEGFRVYLNSVEIEDVERNTINWEWTFNESPGKASFKVARKSDNYNKTLEDLSQAISHNDAIEIKFDLNPPGYSF